MSGLFALAVHSLVDFNLHIPANALAGVTLLGLVASNLRFATEQHWLRARLPLQLALTGVLGLVTIYFGMQEWRRGGETLWLARAERLPNFSPERAAALQKALACEPQNFQTAYDIGECFRTQSLDGGSDYAELAQSALDFYAQSIRLNPHDAYGPLRSGMCLDWLGRHADAEKFYDAAEVCDPNGNYVVANIGWHFVQTGDYAAARQWFMRALKLEWRNTMAQTYFYQICEPKLADQASGRLPPRLFFNGKDR